jgi:di/tricarboxylate transporter
MRLPVTRPKFLCRPMANMGITLCLEDVPHESISARYHVQAKSSELTWTSAFDATAMVAILINLTATLLQEIVENSTINRGSVFTP